jgi:hypothetical protein
MEVFEGLEDIAVEELHATSQLSSGASCKQPGDIMAAPLHGCSKSLNGSAR